MNSIQCLLQTPFSRRSLEDKIQIKTLGRPTPNLNISQKSKSKNHSYQRQFNSNIYKENSWICGCESRNALFCFPCVLFNGEPSWSLKGVTNLAHLQNYIRRHSENKRHLENVLNLTNIGTVNIATQLDNAYRESIRKHNQQVEKNRYILSKIIDCIKFCGSFELALRGHDESDDSNNPGIFRGLIDLMSSVDSAIKDHIESNSIFKGTSKTIQNELLDCMLEVAREEIQKELNLAKYVAIIADDTTDVSEQTQTVVVFRYECSGNVYERFWGFLNPDGQDAAAISECILDQIKPLIPTDKLIAQSYDGAAVMSGKTNGVQAKVKLVYPHARFIHCYAHQLNLIMKQSASRNKSARVFFANLSAIPAFFSNAPARLNVLDAVVARRIPSSSNTRWNFNSRMVNVVYENKESLIECFEELKNSKSDETVQKACGNLNYLMDDEFNFWLSFFSKIMPHVDILFRQIQSRQATSIQIKGAIDSFTTIIAEIREQINDIIVNSENNYSGSAKRSRVSSSLSVDAKEVCDLIISQCKNRFEDLVHVDLSDLVDCSKFKQNFEIFPEQQLKTVVECYSQLNENKLKTELTVIYSRPDLRDFVGVLPLLNFILDNQIDDTFEELTKLLRIIVTSPMSSAEAERCFSTLKRIKSFLRNTMTEKRLNALAMLSIEKEMIKNIENFNSKVIEKFVNMKDRRMDFKFRK